MFLIILNDDLIVGKGAHRACYRHPHLYNRCIKISHKKHQKHAKEQLKEISYYDFLIRRNIRWDLLTRYHGVIDTNMGVGYMFDLVINPNHEPAKTLEHYLNGPLPAGTVDSLLKLKVYLMDNAIVTSELKPRNIACTINKEGGIDSCVIVDDIGNKEFIPVSNYFRFAAQYKIARKWRRFESRLNGFGISLSEK